jgi:hypothetical protein
MKRRDFLKTTASVGAAALTTPLILGDTDKAGSKKHIVGTGEHRYECFHDWVQLPRSMAREWETTHGVCVDEEGLVYIKQQGHAGKAPMDTIIVFDPKGKFIRSFGKDFYPGGHGIDVRKEGKEEFLYLCDVAHATVAKMTLKGDYVWRLGPPKELDVYDKGQKYAPTNLAFAPDGGFYVGDGYGSHYIHQYDKDAKWVRTWGGAGSAPGRMQTPHGIWLDDRPGRKPSLVVADRANARLQYFTLDGKHIGFVKEVSFPAHFDIRGDVLLVPDLHARVSLFDKDNKVIAHLGYDPEWTKKALDGFKMRANPAQWEAGRFIHPHDACYDHDGNIYVAEWVATGRVTFLRHVS